MSESAEKRSLDMTATLHVELAEARDGAKKRVEITRIVRCPLCFATYRTGPGCGECEGGLATRDEVLTVTVPAGVAHGAELRLAKKGHESTRDDTGDLFLKITLPKIEEEKKPSAPSKAVPTTRSRWQTFASDPRNRALVGFALAGPVLVGLYCGVRALEKASRPDVGSICAKSTDCGSGLCLELYTRDEVVLLPGYPAYRGLPKKTGGVCSRECADDSDCPTTMTCAPANVTKQYVDLPDFGLGPGAPNAKACAPRPVAR